MSVPEGRIATCNRRGVREAADFVLYWMIASRRVRLNFALQRAVDWARQLEKPLVIFEPLRCGYEWASERLHRFVIDGMAENARRLKKSPALYHCYLEPQPGDGKGLLGALAEHACVVVTDDYPAFFLPSMVAKAARTLPVLLEKVDSNGLLPVRSTDRVFETAYSFRRFLQKTLPAHLGELPKRNPLGRLSLPTLDRLPPAITDRWPDATPSLLDGDGPDLSRMPIDHNVGPAELEGGSSQGERALKRFLDDRLSGYAEDRNHPDESATSELSPYLHFGHVSSHQLFAELMKREDWDVDCLSSETTGKRSGWWGVGANAEAWLDQFVTWRELGFNSCAHREGYDRYDSLPEWARQTLADHADDERPHLYSVEELEQARTHDGVWNAAQTQLSREGQLHNYLRMLWGKKILEWSPSPQDALESMVELNNKYALDGRDPNSYSGIFWCLGRYDRPWGPERPVFGKIRYMSSDNTVRKLRLSEYLERYVL